MWTYSLCSLEKTYTLLSGYFVTKFPPLFKIASFVGAVKEISRERSFLWARAAAQSGLYWWFQWRLWFTQHQLGIWPEGGDCAYQPAARWRCSMELVVGPAWPGLKELRSEAKLLTNSMKGWRGRKEASHLSLWFSGEAFRGFLLKTQSPLASGAQMKWYVFQQWDDFFFPELIKAGWFFPHNVMYLS